MNRRGLIAAAPAALLGWVGLRQPHFASLPAEQRVEAPDEQTIARVHQWMTSARDEVVEKMRRGHSVGISRAVSVHEWDELDANGNQALRREPGDGVEVTFYIEDLD